MVRTKSAAKVRSSADTVLFVWFGKSRGILDMNRGVEMADLIPDDADLYMMAVVFHTVLLSVMTLTMHPVPAISVSWNHPWGSSAKISRGRRRNGGNALRTFSCQPNNTLPLTSPQPGIAIPLYKYFMSVS